MKKVYLFCSAGMSTSMLAAKMQEVANSHQLDMEVAAFPHEQIGEIIAAKHPDCILLGPQVKYLYDQTVKEYGKTGIPIAVIDSGDDEWRESFKNCNQNDESSWEIKE